MIYITRKENFNAAHRVYIPELSDEKNYELFGACSNPNWHGHNYVLFVTIKGVLDKKSGYLIDIKKLSKLIKDLIINKVDHKNLNLEVDFMKGLIPSLENIAVAVFHVLAPEIKKLGIELHCIKIYETENNYVEYFGE